MTADVVIIGAGGSGREIADVIRADNSKRLVGFVVDKEYCDADNMVDNLPTLGGIDWLGEHRDKVIAICSVGRPELRRKIVERARKLGVRFVSIAHPSAVIAPSAEIGEGVVIPAGCLIGNSVKLRRHVQLNLGCTIAHDSVVDDYATLAPGVSIAGWVRVSVGASLGIGASVIDRLQIGEWSVVGAGCAVTRNVPPNSTVVGVPGRVIKKREAGWHLR